MLVLNRQNDLWMDSIEYLGHFFDENGVKLSDSRVQCLRDITDVGEGFYKFHWDSEQFFWILSWDCQVILSL